MNRACRQTELGIIRITSEGAAITKIEFLKTLEKNVFKDDDLINEAFSQIELFVQGKIKDFAVPFVLNRVSKFQQKVLEIVSNIPYGTTKTYKEIAEAAGNSRAYRAVGMTLNKNPVPIIIPCHRVVGTSGKLTGYAGGLAIKQKLLQVENKYSS